jgi:hypothetical protein
LSSTPYSGFTYSHIVAILLNPSSKRTAPICIISLAYLYIFLNDSYGFRIHAHPRSKQ